MLDGRKVLLLESDTAATFALSSGLRKNGWAVLTAMDAAQAMQIGRQQLVVEAYVAERNSALDAGARLAATGNGVIGATRALLRGLPRCGPAERSVLARIAEEQSRRMARLVA